MTRDPFLLDTFGGFSESHAQNDLVQSLETCAEKSEHVNTRSNRRSNRVT